MNADTLLKVALAILSLLVTVTTIVGGLCSRFVTYLFARIKVLEERESTLLVGMVAGVKQQGEELAKQGDVMRQLAEEAKHREWERNREKGGS